jgi:hypothetical protein
MKMRPLLIALGFVFISRLITAADLESIPQDQAKAIGEKLSEEAGKIDNLKFKIDADTDKANGFHVPKKLGALIVPQKDLKESEELAAKFKMDPGASLAYLFIFKVAPVIDGKKIDTSLLHSTSIKDDQGNEHAVQVLLLSVRQLADDDYRLYGFGKDAKPIIDAKFAEGTSTGPTPVAVELKEVNDTTREGKVVVTVFGKFQASFQAGYTGD